MKTIIFNNEISTETIYNLIQDVEVISDGEQVLQKEDGQILYERTIYFASGGGDTEAANCLVDYINYNSQFLITLVGFWNISSAAFSIFTKANCTKRLMSGNAFSVIHLMDRDGSYRDLKKKNSFDKFLIEQMDIQNNQILDWYRKIGVTEEQIIEIKSGEDVYVDRDQLEKIMNFTIKLFDKTVKPSKKKKSKIKLDK